MTLCGLVKTRGWDSLVVTLRLSSCPLHYDNLQFPDNISLKQNWNGLFSICILRSNKGHLILDMFNLIFDNIICCMQYPGFTWYLCQSASSSNQSLTWCLSTQLFMFTLTLQVRLIQLSLNNSPEIQAALLTPAHCSQAPDICQHR